MPITSDGTGYDLHGAEAAPALVLIHGLGLNRRIWEPHLPALSARYRVIAYDLYGNGQSALPPAKPTLSVYAGQLRALMDTLGIHRAAIAGFSLGGMINRRFAMDHEGRAASLLILNSPHERGAAEQKLVEERAANSAAGPAATLDAAIERWFTPEFRAARPDYIDKVRDWVLANDRQVFAECRQVLANGVIELIRPSPPITHPTLVMTCAHDSGSTPAMSHAIAAEIPGAEAVIIPARRHMGLVEAPEAFTRPMLRFLDRHQG
ncbi:alpha/beta fold hydrolase [Rhodobacteraceae bacterium NNCM2]|nr:alpha/beta fold hydrolase [Coraliihabitans acroporae]